MTHTDTTVTSPSTGREWDAFCALAVEHGWKHVNPLAVAGAEAVESHAPVCIPPADAAGFAGRAVRRTRAASRWADDGAVGRDTRRSPRSTSNAVGRRRSARSTFSPTSPRPSVRLRSSRRRARSSSTSSRLGLGAFGTPRLAVHGNRCPQTDARPAGDRTPLRALTARRAQRCRSRSIRVRRAFARIAAY